MGAVEVDVYAVHILAVGIAARLSSLVHNEATLACLCG